MRISTRMMAFMAFTVMMLLLNVVLGVADVKAWTREVVTLVWKAVVATSEGLEMGIEGVGWTMIRAVGRFGKGFEAGYRV